MAARRAAPLVSAWVCLVAVALYEVLTGDPRLTFEPYAVLLVLYTVGRTESRSKAAHRSVLVGAAAGFLVVVTASGQAAPMALSAFAVFAGVPYGVGVLVTRRERKAEQLATRIALLHDEQELRGRTAAHDERMRVARELHDVAAHCLTAMVVQASAARVVALQDPRSAAEALSTLTCSGRTALSELHRLADLPADREASRAGLETFLAGLADDVAVELTWPDGARTIPAGLGQVAVRIVQEGLTNATRHSPGADVSVRVSVGAEVLDVWVVNGPSVGHVEGESSGFGLLGMRERLATLHGSLSTGPTEAGGYAVHACLPIDSTAAPAIASTSGPRTRDRVLWAGVPLVWSAALVTEALGQRPRAGPTALNVLVVAAMGLAGLLRRRTPVAFLVVVSALSLILSAGLTCRDYATLAGLYTVLVPAYAVGCWAPRRRAVAAMTLWGVAATATGIAQHAHPSGVLGPLMAAGLAACLGALVQAHGPWSKGWPPPSTPCSSRPCSWSGWLRSPSGPASPSCTTTTSPASSPTCSTSPPRRSASRRQGTRGSTARSSRSRPRGASTRADARASSARSARAPTSRRSPHRCRHDRPGARRRRPAAAAHRLPDDPLGAGRPGGRR